jgi:cytoskeleton protein RodZ
MSVRADGGQEREVLLQKGQTARFVADTGFVVTVGNAGGVEISLNGQPLPSLGASGQVIRDLAIPPGGGPSDATKAPSPGGVQPRAGR